MPSYQDLNGVANDTPVFPGDSFRSQVINRALTRGDFFWVRPADERRPFPLFRCCLCGQWTTAAGVQGDHIAAQAHGGNNSLSNLQLVCAPCNEANMHHRAGVLLQDRLRSAFTERGARYAPENIQQQGYPGNSFRARVINARPPEVTLNNFQNQNIPLYRCNHCHMLTTVHGVQGDHIIAQAHGGDDSLGNLQILCALCNERDMHHRAGTSVHQRTRRSLAQHAWPPQED